VQVVLSIAAKFQESFNGRKVFNDAVTVLGNTACMKAQSIFQ
jgi:hypothetical protein